MGQDNKCIIFVANRGFSLTSSRTLLMKYFLLLGWSVVAITAKDGYINQISNLGVTWEEVSFNRGGLSPRKDITAFYALVKIYQKYQPCLIHHFNAKPILLGSLAAYFMTDTKIVNTVTGLGHAFIQGGITRFFAATGYQFLLSRSQATIFQNTDDRQLFLEQEWISTQKAKLIVSSGVDTQRFAPPKHKSNKPFQVLMVGRLLWQKGIREFVEAAQIVKQEHPHVCFNLAGELDLIHPDSIDRTWLDNTVNKGIIKFLGYLTKIEDQLAVTDVFVLPSYYREGVPRVLLEAAACGVPVVTVDVPGCREAVVDGVTGRLVPPRNSQALAEAITELLVSPSLREQMRQAGRKRIETDFDIRVITQQQLAIYRDVGIDLPLGTLTD